MSSGLGAGDRRLQGWLLHERKAYRQLPILPQHRKFNVICLKDPENDRPKYFVMIGHSFGLVSVVYNYNCRSAALTMSSLACSRWCRSTSMTTSMGSSGAHRPFDEARRRNDPLAFRRVVRLEEASALVSPSGLGSHFQP